MEMITEPVAQDGSPQEEIELTNTSASSESYDTGDGWNSSRNRPSFKLHGSAARPGCERLNPRAPPPPGKKYIPGGRLLAYNLITYTLFTTGNSGGGLGTLHHNQYVELDPDLYMVDESTVLELNMPLDLAEYKTLEELLQAEPTAAELFPLEHCKQLLPGTAGRLDRHTLESSPAYSLVKLCESLFVNKLQHTIQELCEKPHLAATIKIIELQRMKRLAKVYVEQVLTHPLAVRALNEFTCATIDATRRLCSGLPILGRNLNAQVTMLREKLYAQFIAIRNELRTTLSEASFFAAEWRSLRLLTWRVSMYEYNGRPMIDAVVAHDAVEAILRGTVRDELETVHAYLRSAFDAARLCETHRSQVRAASRRVAEQDVERRGSQSGADAGTAADGGGGGNGPSDE